VKKTPLSHNKMLVSIAPTFPVIFPDLTLPKSLKLLNSSASWRLRKPCRRSYVSKEYKKLLSKKDFIITSDCPSLVNLVMTYHPELKDSLANIDSPMNAHAKLLKKAYKLKQNKDIKVVFVGPCIAKMDENSATPSSVDYILSFDDLKQWFLENAINSEVIDPSPLEATVQDKLEQASRLYPIQGGMLQSIGMDQFDDKNLTITGFKDCKLFLESINEHKSELRIVEMMICDEGCLGGPFMHESSPQLSRYQIFK
jgi:iron only hydrogenase large subunit-like protein